MTTSLLFEFPGNEALTAGLAKSLNADTGRIELRYFPDDETYLRFDTPVDGRTIALVCTLDRPDGKFLPLSFAAATAREFGAKRVGLIAPYLAYMRQDRRFKPGEALSSALFARTLSAAVDWLITVDPHLHRLPSLQSLFDIPVRTVHAASLIAHWIKNEIADPVLIGPDEESAQWVGAVAGEAGAPVVVLCKKRLGDRAVEISIPELECSTSLTPVLIDDIISSGRTMIETLTHLNKLDVKPAVCIGIHGVFADGAFDALSAAGAARIVTTNTIAHPSNAIDVTSLLAEAVRAMS